DSVVAGRTSSTLGDLLGNNTGAAGMLANAGTSDRVFNLVNLDPNTVDLRGVSHSALPATGRSYLPAANANTLNAVISGSDAGTVDLRGARTSVDPDSLKTQIDGIFGKRTQGDEPPDPANRAPSEEIDRIFQSQHGVTEMDRQMDKA